MCCVRFFHCARLKKMSWKKSIFLIFISFLLSTFIFSPVYAVDNYTDCVWDDQLNACRQIENKCNNGCVPPVLNCPSYAKNVCENYPGTPCNCAGPGTLTCTWSPSSQTAGTCRRGDCGPGYTPSPTNDSCLEFDIDQPSCEAKNPGTCVPATIPQPVPPGVACDICGCQNGEKTTDKCPNCNTKCYNCVFLEKKSYTAIGCLPTNDPQEFIGWLLGAAIGIAGGIAFLLMLWGGFQIITSTGDPEKLNKGKEILTSAIIGLIVIIFSLFLLQLIGVKILQIPGFSK